MISQTFVPDPAAVGQYMTDVAVAMAARGHRVRVYAANRGYENPNLKFPARETMAGADVRRLPFTSFGKKNLLIRIVGTASFLTQCLFIGLFTPNLGGIFFSTSPPMIGFAATIIGLVRRVPVAYWAMDLNPDQLIAMGKIKAGSARARLLEAVNRFILRRAAAVFVLDRFMADRLRARGAMAKSLADRLYVDPPWPHENVLADVHPSANPFRRAHGLEGKFVVMYSGNHSPANPLGTLLSAATRLNADDRLRFVFVGGGLGKKEVERTIREEHSTNIVSLPYQPLSELKYSLTAADVHVVSLGDDMVGIIHPCKIYGAMAAGRPILFLGPKPSHVGDLLDQYPFGWHVEHGDVDGMTRALTEIAALPPEQLAARGALAREVLQRSLTQELLCGRLCTTLEDVMPRI